MITLKKTIKYILLLTIIIMLALPSMTALAADSDSGSNNSSSMTSEERLNAHIVSAVVCIIIAAIIPLIVVTVWSSQLRSIHPKDTAADYIRRDSLKLRVKRDIFLYRKVTKVPRNNQSNSINTRKR